MGHGLVLSQVEELRQSPFAIWFMWLFHCKSREINVSILTWADIVEWSACERECERLTTLGSRVSIVWHIWHMHSWHPWLGFCVFGFYCFQNLGVAFSGFSVFFLQHTEIHLLSGFCLSDIAYFSGFLSCVCEFHSYWAFVNFTRDQNLWNYLCNHHFCKKIIGVFAIYRFRK